ncbi:MAG: helix-turn-helix domain-containing protein [Actinomycetota bacterium]|nr:helix-turn-helix domain-containing protein [Actinomycetota bacterium]
MNNSPPGGEGPLTVLELLASEAPASRFDAVLHRARRASPGQIEVGELERGMHLARTIQAKLVRRERREASIASLLDTARDLTALEELEPLLKLMARRARLLLNLDLAYISVGAGPGAHVHASDGSTIPLDGQIRFRDGGLGIAGHPSGVPQWTADYFSDERLDHTDATADLIAREGLHAIVAVPIRREDTTIGMLYGADRKVRHYTPDELSLIRSLADLAAVAIEKVRLLERARADRAALELDNAELRTRLSRLASAEEAKNRLVGLVPAGCDLATLAQAGAELLDATVLLLDATGCLLAVSGELPYLDDAAIAKASLDACASRRILPVADTCWVAPVLAESESLGVVLMQAKTGLTAEGESLLELFSQSVAMLLLMRRGESGTPAAVRDELLDELLAGTGQPPHRIAHRTRALGIDLGAPHVLVIARLDSGEPNRAAVWASSYARRMAGLRTVHDRDIVLFLPGEDPSAAAKAVSQEMSRLLGHPVSVGAGGPGRDVAEIGRAYLEARRCLDALTALNSVGCAASAQDLGFLGVLLSDDHDANGFIRSVIGPVIDYDSERTGELIATLEAYFASGCSPTNAGRELHVHPNTVSRRLEKVADLLGPDWQTPSHALEIQLALRLLRARTVLHQQRDPSSTALTA